MLPIHWRTENRLNLYNVFGNDLSVLYKKLDDFRVEKTFEVSITGQKLAIETLLRRKFNSKNIYITEDFSDEIVFVCLDNEADINGGFSSDYLEIGLESEGTSRNISLQGEAISLVDYTVTIPAEVNEVEVKKIVEKYRIAGKSYEIIKTGLTTGGGSNRLSENTKQLF
jgi:hypothetical protein